MRTCVVTGAASGIGAATAALLERNGHRVIGVDLRDATIEADLATEDGRARMVDEVSDLAGGRVDVVVANAGTIGQGATDVRLNYFGTVATLEGLRPLLAIGDSPRAVVTASQAVVHEVHDDLVTACLAGDEAGAVATLPTEPSAFDATWIYASTKRALATWVRANAPTSEWAGAGIALNAVAPGVVRTPMTQPLLDDPVGAELLTAAIPMPLGGVAEPSAIAHVIDFLAAAETTAMTGQVLFVDGGGDCVLRGADIWSGARA
jgi:NAD(P)-dependent dehydrogenase (short-subunit alcohol dehydrogenase family)